MHCKTEKNTLNAAKRHQPMPLLHNNHKAFKSSTWMDHVRNAITHKAHTKKKCVTTLIYTSWTLVFDNFWHHAAFFSMHFVQLGGLVAVWPSIDMFLFMCSWIFFSCFSHAVSLWILSLGSTNSSLPAIKHKLLFVN